MLSRDLDLSERWIASGLRFMHVKSETRTLLSDAASRVIWSDRNYEGFWFPFIFWVVPEGYSDSICHKGMPHSVDVRPY